DEWNSRRARVAARYVEALRDTDLMLPEVCDGADPVWHLFVIRGTRRDELQMHLKSAGVTTLVHYPVPPHLQEAYSELELTGGSLPITEAIHREALSLPMGPHLNDFAVERVVHAVRSFR